MVRESEGGRAMALGRVWKSEDLFTGQKKVLIEHAGFYYSLMITKSGKLVLNK